MDPADIREKLEKIVGINPDLGDTAVNTMFYFLPDFYDQSCHTRRFTLLVSGRTSRYRCMDTQVEHIGEIALSNICDIFGDLVKDMYPYCGAGYDFLIPPIAKILHSQGIELPRTG